MWKSELSDKIKRGCTIWTLRKRMEKIKTANSTWMFTCPSKPHPGSNTPQNSSCTAIHLPSWKISKTKKTCWVLPAKQRQNSLSTFIYGSIHMDALELADEQEIASAQSDGRWGNDGERERGGERGKCVREIHSQRDLMINIYMFSIHMCLNVLFLFMIIWKV